MPELHMAGSAAEQAPRPGAWLVVASGSILGAASLHRVGLTHLRVRCLSGVTPGTVSYVDQCIASPTVHPSEALPGTRDRSSRRAAPRSLFPCMTPLSAPRWPTN